MHEESAQELYDGQTADNPMFPPYLLKLQLGKLRRIEKFGPFRLGLC